MYVGKLTLYQLPDSHLYLILLFSNSRISRRFVVVYRRIEALSKKKHSVIVMLSVVVMAM